MQILEQKKQAREEHQITPLSKLVVERKGDLWRAEVFVWELSIQWAEDANKVEAIRDCMDCLHDMAISCTKAAHQIEELYFR